MKYPFSIRFFRLLLLLYPAEFRKAYGAQMERAFTVSLDQHLDERGRLGLPYVWVRVAWDALTNGVTQRVELRRTPTHAQPKIRTLGTAVESILQDVRYAARRLRRTPGFTVVVVLTAGIGITVTALIFAIVNASILRPPPHVANPNEIVKIHREYPSRGAQRYRVSYADFQRIREQATTLVDAAALVSEVEFIARIGLGMERKIIGAEVSDNYFRLLGTPLLFGGGFLQSDAAERRDVAVAGHGFWQRELGGDRDALGRTLQIDGRRYTVVGVTPPSYSWLSQSAAIEPDIWIPITQNRRKIGGGSTLSLIGRRRHELTIAQVQAELEPIGQRLATLTPAEWDDASGGRARLVALTDLQSRIPAGARALPSLIIWTVLVGLIMLITCSNVANLLLNRGLRRNTEVAIRLSLGSGRGRLVRQLLTESLVLFALAGAVSLLLIHWITQLLVTGRGPFPFAVDITVDLRVIVFAMGLTIASGLVFGLAPALQASRPDLMQAIKGTGGSLPSRRFRARNMFVLAQVAGSMVLVVISTLFARDVQQADALDMGFDDRNVGVLSLDLSLRDYDEQTGRLFLATLSHRLEGIPEVEAVATSGWVPLSGRWWNWGGFQPEGYEPGRDESPRAMWNVVSPGYFQLIGMPLIGGRDFRVADNTEAPDVIIVNQAFATLYWPNQEPVGKRVILEEGDSPAEVIGVVRDAKYGKADYVAENSRAHFWTARAQRPSSFVELHFKARGDPAALFGTVRQEVRTLDPDLPISDLRRMDGVVATALLEERVGALVFAGFGAVSVFLAVLGIYGVMAYGIMQRARELGIRLALGARPTRVIAMVVKESLAMSAAGIVAGLALAALVAQGVRSLLLGIELFDPISYGGSVAVLVLAATAASAIPALRAARVDPVRSLRSE